MKGRKGSISEKKKESTERWARGLKRVGVEVGIGVEVENDEVIEL